MRKMLILPMLACCTLPAQAEWTAKSIAEVYSVMAVYDAYCGGLPPAARISAAKLSVMVERSELGPAMLNTQTQMYTVGKEEWCTTFAPHISRF